MQKPKILLEKWVFYLSTYLIIFFRCGWVFTQLHYWQVIFCFQLLKRHHQARLGGGKDDALPIKVIFSCLVDLHNICDTWQVIHSSRCMIKTNKDNKGLSYWTKIWNNSFFLLPKQIGTITMVRGKCKNTANMQRVFLPEVCLMVTTPQLVLFIMSLSRVPVYLL